MFYYYSISTILHIPILFLAQSAYSLCIVINNAQQTAAFGQMIGQATSPIVAAVNALQSDVNGIKCKLPETVTLPYSCATAVPTQAVFNGYALGTYAGWNGCGCNNSLWG